MSGVIANGPPELSYVDFARMYAPTALPQAAPAQGSGLAALGQPQQYVRPQQGGQPQGPQGQQGGALPFLGQLSQLGAPGMPAAQAGVALQGQPQPGQGGLQQLLIGALNNNGANGSSNALANAVGYVPFGTGSFG